jgi:phage-related tail protein
VIESAVTTEAWKQECARVDKQLMMPIQQSGGIDQLDDFYGRREQVMKHLEIVSEFTIGETPELLDQLIEMTKKDLKKIKKKEQKLNTSNDELISVISKTQQSRINLISDLKSLSISNQSLLEQVDEVEESLEQCTF